MQHFFPALIFSILGVFSTAVSQEFCSTPESPKTPDIAVDLHIPRARIRHDLSLKEIRELQTEKGLKNADSVLGFTYYETQNGYKVKHEIVVDGNKEVCGWVKSIKVYLLVKVLDIFIPSDYAPKSCEYQVVISHESDHHRILEETLREYQNQIRKFLLYNKTIPSNSNPKLYSNEPLKDSLSTIVEEEIRPQLDSMVQAIEIRQKTIDSPEHYMDLTSKCSSWELVRNNK